MLTAGSVSARPYSCDSLRCRAPMHGMLTHCVSSTCSSSLRFISSGLRLGRSHLSEVRTYVYVLLAKGQTRAGHRSGPLAKGRGRSPRVGAARQGSGPLAKGRGRSPRVGAARQGSVASLRSRPRRACRGRGRPNQCAVTRVSLSRQLSFSSTCIAFIAFHSDALIHAHVVSARAVKLLASAALPPSRRAAHMLTYSSPSSSLRTTAWCQRGARSSEHS